MSIPTESDPHPRVECDPRPSTLWPVRWSLRCPPVIAPSPQDFSTVIETRRSTRAIRPAPLRELVNLIAFATRPRFVREGDLLARSRRLSPSAGALHPIDVILVNWRGMHRVMRYNMWEHQLELLVVRDAQPLQNLAQKCVDVLPEARGTALILLACLPTVSAAYENPTSLLWRDAGALLQTLALTATAHRLAFCPLGILGGEIVQAIGFDKQRVQSAGVAMVGRFLDEAC